MKIIISQKFSKRLLNYGALSIAISGISEAKSQIIYTDVNPDEGGLGLTSIIDFNHDGLWDAKITHRSNAYPGPGGSLINSLKPGNAAIAYYAEPFGRYSYPLALDFDTLISAGNPNWESYGQNQWMNWGDNCYNGNSQWCAVFDKYLGIRFKIGANIHYGWARLDVANSNNWKLKDYAYNATPDAPINAGQTILGVEDNNLSKIKIIGLNKSIGIYNLQEPTDYKLFSISGQELLKGRTSNKDYVIEASNVASGIYIVELADIKSSAVIRKKVVLQ